LASAMAHVVFRTCYTVVSIPYSALSARMVRDSRERGLLAGVRMIFATLGGLFTVFMTLPLATFLGGGDLLTGFLWVGIVYGVLASLIFLVTFFSTREQPPLASAAPMSLAASWRLLRGNRALWVLIGAIVLGSTASAIFGKGLVYYVKYVAGLDLSITTALVALTGAVSLSVPLWMLVSRYLDKRMVWLCGSVLTVLAQSILYFFPPSGVATFLAVLALLGAGTAAFNVTFWSMLPDTVEYGEWRSGVRDEGIVFGLNQLALKTASGIGIGALGIMLEAIGYVANEPQSAATVAGMRDLVILLPLLLGLLSAAVIAAYPVSRELHGRLLRAIAWRARREAIA
ncbi:MAG TPA: MFS transporter, partial [Kineobactrum sp.]